MFPFGQGYRLTILAKFNFSMYLFLNILIYQSYSHYTQSNDWNPHGSLWISNHNPNTAHHETFLCIWLSCMVSIEWRWYKRIYWEHPKDEWNDNI